MTLTSPTEHAVAYGLPLWFFAPPKMVPCCFFARLLPQARTSKANHLNLFEQLQGAGRNKRFIGRWSFIVAKV